MRWVLSAHSDVWDGRPAIAGGFPMAVCTASSVYFMVALGGEVQCGAPSSTRHEGDVG